MALLTVEGRYRNGRIDLEEEPNGIEDAHVIVTFFPDTSANPAREAERQAAMSRLFARMEQGVDFGGEKFDRNTIYEERMQQLDARREQLE